MDKDQTKIPEMAASKAADREMEKHPVQQLDINKPVTEEEVEEAVEELNPTEESLDWRG